MQYNFYWWSNLTFETDLSYSIFHYIIKCFATWSNSLLLLRIAISILKYHSYLLVLSWSWQAHISSVLCSVCPPSMFGDQLHSGWTQRNSKQAQPAPKLHKGTWFWLIWASQLKHKIIQCFISNIIANWMTNFKNATIGALKCIND